MVSRPDAPISWVVLRDKDPVIGNGRERQYVDEREYPE